MNAFWNRFVNALSLIFFILMISTGFLLKWVLPAGSGRTEMIGSGRHGKVVYTLMSLDRHDWGDIHFYISLGLILVLGVHLILHRKWILATAWGSSANPQPMLRKLITIGILTFIIISLSFPWMLQKQVYP